MNVDRKYDAKSRTEAQGLCHQIKSSVFIAAFNTANYVFGYTVGLSRALQGSTVDILNAYSHIKVVRDQMKDLRRMAKTFADFVYQKMKIMAKKGNVKISKPRTCGRQTLRSNTASKTPASYFRRTVFIPFLDNLLQQIDTRFNGLTEAALLGLLLIPVNVHKLDSPSKEKLIRHYSPDLPSVSSASQEFDLWKRFW